MIYFVFFVIQLFFAAQIKKAPRPGCRRGRPCLLCLPFSIAAKRGCPSWAFPSLRLGKVTTFPPFLQIFPNLLITPKAPTSTSPRRPGCNVARDGMAVGMEWWSGRDAIHRVRDSDWNNKRNYIQVDAAPPLTGKPHQGAVAAFAVVAIIIYLALVLTR